MNDLLFYYRPNESTPFVKIFIYFSFPVDLHYIYNVLSRATKNAENVKAPEICNLQLPKIKHNRSERFPCETTEDAGFKS